MTDAHRRRLEQQRDARMARLRALPNLMRGSHYKRPCKRGRASYTCAPGGPKRPSRQLTGNLRDVTHTRKVRHEEVAQLQTLLANYEEPWAIVDAHMAVYLVLLYSGPPSVGLLALDNHGRCARYSLRPGGAGGWHAGGRPGAVALPRTGVAARSTAGSPRSPQGKFLIWNGRSRGNELLCGVRVDVLVRVENTLSQGGIAANRDLFERRAQAIVAHFRKKGVDAARLKPRGLGEGRTPSGPLASLAAREME